jgi:nitroimidazol reductase NimA-like FMN-containing flavoprotein (pyridoxamine 5'-phosphate oxidase superfamily)
MPKMTESEVDTFLGEPGHLLRLATTDDAGAPLVVPIWFIYGDGRVYFTPRERSAWREYLDRDSRVCLLIDESDATMRKVVVTGRADLVHALGHDDEWRDMYRRIALRYVSEAWADAYLHDTIDEPRALYSVDLDSSEVTTWRMPAQPGEDPLAVWAPRYYHRGV